MNLNLYKHISKLQDEIDAINDKDPCVLEEKIVSKVHDLGNLILKSKLEQLDIEEDQIIYKNTLYYKREKSSEQYISTMGKFKIERSVYQTSSGGTTYVPLEHKVNFVKNATPSLAKATTFFCGAMSTTQTQEVYYI
jgi:hypothetical protein